MNVLIAEDHTITAKLLSKMLSKYKYINVIGIASDGREVLELEAKNKVDVLLLDITMPVIDGLEVMERLFDKNSKVKILILSAHSEGWIIEKSLRLGASGYLTKKVDMNEIIEAIISVHNGVNYMDDNSLIALINSHKNSKS